MGHFTELFCHIDDFCQTFEPEYQKHLIANGKKCNRRACLSHSGIITIYTRSPKKPDSTLLITY